MSHVTIHRRNIRYGLESASPFALVCHMPGIIEALILTAVTNSALFALGPQVVSFVSSALSYLATTAIVMGLQYLLMPKPPKPDDVRVPRVQAMPYRIYGVGTNRLAGAYMLWEEKDGWLYSVQALCGHPINAIIGYYLHDDPVVLKEDGITVADGPNERYGNNKILLRTRLGAVPETPYPEHVAIFGSSGLWTNNHRGDGQASIAARFIGASQKNFSKYYPYGAPQPSVVAEMAKVWDPRDPDQDPEDPATWAFSKNAALCMIWQICFNPFGPKVNYQRAILPVIDIWREEADICDELVPRASGGFERRYECNIWATTETDPVAVENAIMAACDGWRCWRGDGALLFRVGKFREELVETIRDRDVVGYSIASDVPEEDEVNRLVPKFTYPATDYTTTDTDFFEDSDAQMRAGRVLSQDGNYGAVHQWRQARRLGKRSYKRLREKIRGNLQLRLSGFNAVYSPWVRLETPLLLPRLNGTIIENRRAQMSLMQGGFRMEFNRLPNDIDEWDPEVDEGQAPPVPAKPIGSGVPMPSLDSVLVISSGGSVSLRVNIFDAGTDEYDPAVRWRIKDVGGGTPGAWNETVFPDTTVEAGLIALTTGAVPAEQLLQVQIAFKAPRGTFSTWVPTTPVEVTTTVDGTAPGVVTSPGASGGAGTATLSWNSPNSANYIGARIFRNSTNNLGTATLVRTEYGPPSTPDGWTDTGLSAGTYYYWIRSINGSGVEATAVATGSVTVT